ncbi:hypothetical protein FRUB_06647 [Fimbriiglobus ruber]|uniref:Uncharacterized protein n=1 Tax=Fimbriiglobus ruber TaxID=1908690 RepID=A0A225DMW0_9BACT|nr:hypothetical protein FRUB_06647 [Fimbriiglobus ruber]
MFHFVGLRILAIAAPAGARTHLVEDSPDRFKYHVPGGVSPFEKYASCFDLSRVWAHGINFCLIFRKLHDCARG